MWYIGGGGDILNFSNFAPTLGEYLLLQRLYRAKREGCLLQSPARPKHSRRLNDRGLIEVSRPAAWRNQTQWETRLTNAGEDFFTDCRKRVTLWCIGTGIAIAAVIVAA